MSKLPLLFLAGYSSTVFIIQGDKLDIAVAGVCFVLFILLSLGGE